jgi:threonyl-tRNA synthetase
LKADAALDKPALSGRALVAVIRPASHRQTTTETAYLPGMQELSRRKPMITVTFPDGAKRDMQAGSTGLEIAASISKSLAKKAVAMQVNGVLADLADPVLEDATISIVTREDAAALELIRHDCAHVMAEAVQELYPGTQVTIGPVIENGFYYDFARDEPFTSEDLSAIEKKMRQIIGRDRPFTKEIWSRDQAKAYFAEKGEHYKVELVDAIPEDQQLKIYKQGEWLDLCRGPHMTSTGKIGEAFKLMSVAGAYWRGDSDNAMLTRIYGTAWASKQDLQAYLTMLEEAEKRDHRRLGREMDLFHFQEEAPGSVFWHADGWTLFQELISYCRRRQNEAGFLEVNSPDMMDKALWEQSGHWEKFGENMYTTETPDERVYCCKPMNCPGHVQIFKNGLKSYRDLPLMISEFGKVHRYEPSGALHGIMRVRHFTQDDAHIFITEDQITEECLRVHSLILSIYEDFGFDDIRIKFSDRPEKRVGEDAIWDKSEAALRYAIDQTGQEWTLNPGEGAFYGPKLEYVLRDAIGRDWQCGTLQVDFNLPDRLGAFYIGADGEKHVPVMLHRAMFGSLERFTGILIENYAGHFPLWLSPRQLLVATITQEADDYAQEVQAACKAAGLRADIDLRNEKIGYKVREHSLAKVPVLMIVGKNEAEEKTVSIRKLGSREQTTMPLSEALSWLAGEAVPPDMKRAAMEKAA